MRDLSARRSIVLSPQSLNETYRVMIRRFSAAGAVWRRENIEDLAQWCTAPLDISTTRAAWAIEDQTGFQWFDCLLLASAIDAGCSHFLSEDMSHGRVVGPLTIVDPFRLTPADFPSPI